MKHKNRVIMIALVLAILLLSPLAYYAHTYPYFMWDLAITRLLQSHHNVFWDYFLGAVSWPGYPPVVYYITIFIIGILTLLKWYRAALFESISVVLQSLLGYFLKYEVDRPRAPNTLINVIHVGLEGGRYSFPAGHVESYVAILGFLAIVIYIKLKPSIFKKIILFILFLFIVFIGPSRVYMGEHWTSDVIGGYLVGVISLLLTYIGYNHPFIEKLFHGRQTHKKSSKI